MTVRVINVDRGLSQMRADDRQAWERWLEQHRLDPFRIPLDADIICDDGARTVATEYYVFDSGGGVVLDGQGDDREARRETVRRQLEAAALPTPGGLGVTLYAD